jgi:hypothetical protein
MLHEIAVHAISQRSLVNTIMLVSWQRPPRGEDCLADFFQSPVVDVMSSSQHCNESCLNISLLRFKKRSASSAKAGWLFMVVDIHARSDIETWNTKERDQGGAYHPSPTL